MDNLRVCELVTSLSSESDLADFIYEITNYADAKKKAGQLWPALTKPGPSNLNFTPISGPAVEALDDRKECDNGPSEAQVTADARRFLNLSLPSSTRSDVTVGDLVIALGAAWDKYATFPAMGRALLDQFEIRRK